MTDGESLVLLANSIPEGESSTIIKLLKENGIESISSAHYSRYASAGYVAIRIKEKDHENAVKIMVNNGYSVFNEDESQQDFLKMLVSPMENFQFLAKYSLNTKLIILILSIAIAMTALLVFFQVIF